MDDSTQSDSQDSGVFSFSNDGSIVDDSVAMAEPEEVDVERPGDPTSATTIQANTSSEEFPETGTLSTRTDQAVLSATDDGSSSDPVATTPDESVAQSSGSSTPVTATSVDVSVGGGMIEVISKAKGISMPEAEKVYYAMKAKGQIYGIPGTYDMSNNDIGISAPGPFTIGQELMADIDAAAGVSTHTQQDTSDVLGQTDRPQEATSQPSGSEDTTTTTPRNGVSVDSAPRSIIDTRIAPFPDTPNNL